MKEEVMKEGVIEKMKSFMPCLHEKQKRMYVASEAKALGRGGKQLIERELGVSHHTINRGMSELDSMSLAIEDVPGQGQRKKAAGENAA